MKISLNTIKGMNARYHCCDDVTAIGPEALAEKIGAQLGAIEEIEHIGAKYDGIIIVKIVSCRKHQDSDHLNVCLIDDGGKAIDVERDAEGLVQVVCGAPNVREGLLVAWLPPGSTVPESVGKEPFVLDARELRGVISNGMLASARELALGDSHEGILEIIDPFAKIQPGDDFAEAYGLKDDVLFDIENKMFTHRPDCFGFLGVSRELAGIQGMPFTSPEWYTPTAQIPTVEAEKLPLAITNELPELVPRFTALALRDVAVGPSPTWLVVALAKVGARSINNIVDYTNFFMLQTGQPLHAYDYDKVAALTDGQGAEITIRKPHQGEKIALLNGKTIQPRSEAIMIASGDHLIGVGGVMGGADTEVDETTKNIILEVASFDMYSIRRTSMANGLFTDAVTRFNKGQSPLQNQAVMAKIVTEIRTYASGKVASEFIDINQLHNREWVHPPVPVTAQFINERLGFNLNTEQMKTLLTNVECNVEINGDQLTVTAPFWRTDIETREDVVEEVGRLYGFDKLPLELPKRTIAPATTDQLFTLKSTVRASLAHAGANEVLTYSFVHGDLLQKVGQPAEKAFRVSNALSPDLQYYRLSLTPSLLDKIHANVKAGYDTFALFELGKAHVLGEYNQTGLPREFERLSLVYADRKKTGAAYYDARIYLENLLHTLGVSEPLSFKPFEPNDTDVATTYYQPNRSAMVYVGDTLLGQIGEYKASVRKSLKLPEYTAGFEISLDVLRGQKPTQAYKALPKFPKVSQDITLKVNTETPVGAVTDCINQVRAGWQNERYYAEAHLSDLYQGSDTTTKNITYRFTIASYERTLTDAEVAKMIDAAVLATQQSLTAERV